MRYGRPGRPTGFLHNACVDLSSEVSGRQPSGRLFFARTSCLDTRETRCRLPSPSSFTPPLLSPRLRIHDESIHASRRKKRDREREKRERLESQIFDGNLSTVNLSIFRDLCFGFGTFGMQTRFGESVQHER